MALIRHQFRSDVSLDRHSTISVVSTTWNNKTFWFELLISTWVLHTGLLASPRWAKFLRGILGRTRRILGQRWLEASPASFLAPLVGYITFLSFCSPKLLSKDKPVLFIVMFTLRYTSETRDVLLVRHYIGLTWGQFFSDCWNIKLMGRQANGKFVRLIGWKTNGMSK